MIFIPCFKKCLETKMTRIKIYKIFSAIFFCCFAFKGVAQTKDITTAKTHHFTFYAGVGPNYYFNNLVIAKNKVNEFNYSFIGRIMWEPKHNLSLGIESGYNQLYTFNADLPSPRGNVHIVNVAIPIRIVISMKFFHHFYANFNMGQSILLNKVSSSNYGTFDASSISLGDFGLDFGYKRLISDRIYLGSEIKGFYSSKLEDKNIALVFFAGFRF